MLPAKAGVAKAMFYMDFPSKDDLIVAWIECSEAAALKAPAVSVAQPLTDHALAMIVIADLPSCMGCTYQISAAEFSAPAPLARGPWRQAPSAEGAGRSPGPDPAA